MVMFKIHTLKERIALLSFLPVYTEFYMTLSKSVKQIYGCSMTPFKSVKQIHGRSVLFI